MHFMTRRVHAADLRWFARVACWHAPPLDRTLPRLSNAANNSLLWLGCSAVLAVAGGRYGQRAAARGLVSIGATTALVNQVLKPLARRQRPTDPVPAIRRLRRVPSSTSFPSGHAASAAAFATGAALELPESAVVLGPLAAAVAFSRVYTGVHYPSDVLAGAAIGTGMALATTRVWPRAPRTPAAVAPTDRAHVEPRAGGAGVVLIVNDQAGPPFRAPPLDELKRRLPRARVIEVDTGDRLKDAIQEALDGGEVLGIWGGDGTAATAASAAAEAGKPLFLIPGGTLNHFARDLGLHSPADAMGALERGEGVRIDLGEIPGEIFVNTASLGGYPEMVDMRRRLERRMGKPLAGLIALARTLLVAKPIELELDGRERTLWLLFAGNCVYEPPGFWPSWRARLDDGLLDIRVVDGSRRLARLRVLLAVATGRLGRCRVYEHWTAPSAQLASRAGPLRLAHDGEAFDGPPRFELQKRPRELFVYAPLERPVWGLRSNSPG